MNNKQQNQTITPKQILWYFIIFSIIGLIIETLFCYITTGVLESRKGLIWGPFCPVYGLGATLLILLLHSYKEKPILLFILGSIFGNIIEYLVSFLLEAYYGTRFWDYSYLNWNLNGRICILYSVYWGVLSFVLIQYVKKWIDQYIDKIPNKKTLHIVILGILVLDGICTVWAITSYQTRIGIEYYHKPIQTKKNALQNIKAQIEETLFSDEIMLKTFPNLRYIDDEGKEYYIKDIKKAN